jgi:hypothetical protein
VAIEDYLSRGDRDLAVFGPFTKGVNNRLSDSALGGDMLRQAINCYLDDAGRLHRRDGHARVETAADGHSLYAGDEGVFFVDGTALRAYSTEADTVVSLRTDLTASAKMAWLEVNGEMYYSNGHQRGKLRNGALREWGVEVPAGLPALTAAAGMLPPGRYEVLCTFSNDEGEESGAGRSIGITLASDGAIQASILPQPTAAGVVAVNVYMTPTNGAGVFYRAASVVVGTTAVTLTTFDPAKELKTQFIVPPPAGNVLAYAGGRFFIADGKIVWYTEPYALGRCAIQRSFLMFKDDVTLMAGTKNGLYVAAGKTYFMSAADPATAELDVRLPYGAAFGSLAPMPMYAEAEAKWTWRSDRGQVIADENGKITNLQEAQLVLDSCATGASALIEVDGMKQIVSLGVPKADSAAEARDFVEMEVRRRAS